MARKRITMRKIKDIYRLKLVCGLSHRQISASTGVSKGTVGDYLLRARTAGLGWPEIDGMDESELERRLFPSSRPSRASPSRALPDWGEIHQELKGKGVTLALLWQEYKELCPEGYEYSRFCGLYRIWSGKLDVCLRQEHKAGERLFLDPLFRYCPNPGHDLRLIQDYGFRSDVAGNPAARTLLSVEVG